MSNTTASNGTGRYDSLFRYIIESEIVLAGNTKIPVIARQLGILDARKREEFAKEESIKSVEQLRDPESEQRRNLDAWIAEQTDERLIDAITERVSGKLADEARREIFAGSSDSDEPPPTTITEVIDEELNDRRVDREVMELRRQYIIDNLPIRIKPFTVDRPTMENAVRDAMIEKVIEGVYGMAWSDATLFYGVLKSDGTPLFSEIPHDANIPPEVKSQAVSIYRKIDEASYRPSS